MSIAMQFNASQPEAFQQSEIDNRGNSDATQVNFPLFFSIPQFHVRGKRMSSHGERIENVTFLVCSDRHDPLIGLRCYSHGQFIDCK